MPRLVHEMTNQLLIIAGNAQIADRSDNDPLLAAQSVKAIRQASETAGRLLDGYASFLRRLPATSASGSVSEAASLIAENASQNPGWRIDLSGPSCRACGRRPAMDRLCGLASGSRIQGSGGGNHALLRHTQKGHPAHHSDVVPSRFKLHAANLS